MSQHNFTNRFVPASSLSIGSTPSSTSNPSATTNRRSSFYSNSAMMANSTSSSVGSTNSFPKPTTNGSSVHQQTPSQQGSSTLLFSHANRRESFGAPPARFSTATTTNASLGVSQLIHSGGSSNNSLMNSSVTSGNSLNTSGASSVLERNLVGSGSSMLNTNNNRNSLSGSFSQQNRKRTMLPPTRNTFHNIIGNSSQKEDVLSPEETCKTNPLDEALVKENADLKKENEELKQQLQKLKYQMVEREKEMVDKEDQLKKAQFASKEVSDCKKYIETMSLKLIELGVDPNTLKQHPSSTLSYDLSNILIGSSIELDDSVRELENVLSKYSPLYSRTSSLMQLED